MTLSPPSADLIALSLYQTFLENPVFEKKLSAKKPLFSNSFFLLFLSILPLLSKQEKTASSF